MKNNIVILIGLFFISFSLRSMDGGKLNKYNFNELTQKAANSFKIKICTRITNCFSSEDILQPLDFIFPSISKIYSELLFKVDPDKLNLKLLENINNTPVFKEGVRYFYEMENLWIEYKVLYIDISSNLLTLNVNVYTRGCIKNKLASLFFTTSYESPTGKYGCYENTVYWGDKISGLDYSNFNIQLS